MGKKTRRIQSISERRGLQDELLRITAMQEGVTSAKLEWQAHEQTRSLVDKIRNLEATFERPTTPRKERMEALLEWAKDSLKIDVSSIKIEENEKKGFGFVASRDMAENEVILTIPDNYFLKLPRNGPVAKFISQDKMLIFMPNVALAVYLLSEYFNKKSFWKVYFDALPDSFDTVLYWSDEELKRLKGSVAFGEAIKLYRNIARQYAYLSKVLQAYGDPQLPLISYDQYRWAVSVIMTRQNALNPEAFNTALVPLWDNCNHEVNAVASTDYVIAKEKMDHGYAECHLTQAVKAGNPITINYGKKRILQDLLLHCGFVPEITNALENPIRIKLGISTADRLYAKRLKLLALFGLEASCSYEISCDLPEKSLLYVFIRVFHMDEATIEKWLESDNYSVISMLEDSPAGEEIERKAWNLLKERLSLILASYTTTKDEDMAAAKSDQNRLAFATRLKTAEKCVLQRLKEICIEYIERLDKEIPSLEK
ncbi:DgyrCDS9933 [Dimorphilus gyrociliatus]|uniref:protein-histidine N-methyltransferase n=1 Tax=Dimorphilus gyrociliatus TaxID=2664684 RepID=A0A7I8VZT3_9ANNE|nr:DgyrCDS9933 [Dimorphilus gyrociliatus]